MKKTIKAITATALTAFVLLGTTGCLQDTTQTVEGVGIVQEKKAETAYRMNKKNRPYTRESLYVCPTAERVEGDGTDCRWLTTDEADYNATEVGDSITFNYANAYRK